LQLQKQMVTASNNMAITLMSHKFSHATLNRTVHALGFIRNSLTNIYENINDMRVHLAEYQARLDQSINKLKYDIKEYKNLNFNRDKIGEMEFQLKLEEINDNFHGQVKNLYESSMSWIVLSKLAYATYDQLNHLDNSPLTTDLDKLSKAYFAIRSKEAEYLDDQLADQGQEMLKNLALARGKDQSSALDYFCRDKKQDDATFQAQCDKWAKKIETDPWDFTKNPELCKEKQNFFKNEIPKLINVQTKPAVPKCAGDGEEQP